MFRISHHHATEVNQDHVSYVKKAKWEMSSQKVSWCPLQHRFRPSNCSSPDIRGTILVGGHPLRQFKLLQFYTDVTHAR